ncbi:S1 RNA-binding domain-containing protein [Candidatus Gracilibacteria bacterium]|jgi:small subunit ribosomal protein S1|nr:S1 RNA-binding domain-containing protein [Candidatus Gracilibacteria bacterium]NJP17945.1 S1 RNA-binding domain-containing protein [Hydrococcus sp. CRU_1_1]
MTAKSNFSQEPGVSFSLDDFAKALDQHDYQFSKGQVVRGTVFEHISDGAYVDIGGKSPGFVPAREAAVRSDIPLAESLPLQETKDFLIISGQNEDGQVTLSRRQLELQKAWENIAEIAESGKSTQMRVTGTNKGGVIGEVEGLRGFIPRSHLMEKEDLESLVGQLLTATFLEVDPENKKLVLSQRQAARAAAIGKLAVGELMKGKVVKMQPYGVFVDMYGVTGLLHVRQVSGAPVDALTTIFNIGQEIEVMIVEIDEYKNRVSLSTKILENYPGEILEKFDEVMATASERVEQAKAKLAE